MKKSRIVSDALCALSLAAAIAAIAFLPDEIPVHFGFSGEADRYGSPREMLIFPALILAARLLMAGLTRFSASVEKDDAAGPVMRRVTAIVLAFFLALQLYFTLAAAADVQNLNELPVDVWQLTVGGTGLVFIPVGASMPKLKRNAAAGFRTKWSMMNDEVWALSQRFAGRSMVICGALVFILALLLPGAWSAAAAAVIFIVMIAADCRYARSTYFRLRGFED